MNSGHWTHDNNLVFYFFTLFRVVVDWVLFSSGHQVTVADMRTVVIVMGTQTVSTPCQSVLPQIMANRPGTQRAALQLWLLPSAAGRMGKREL